jgi:hypothetical protein
MKIADSPKPEEKPSDIIKAGIRESTCDFMDFFFTDGHDVADYDYIEKVILANIAYFKNKRRHPDE